MIPEPFNAFHVVAVLWAVIFLAVMLLVFLKKDRPD